MKKYTIGFLVFALVAISTVFAIGQKDSGNGWKGGRGGHRGGFGRIAEKLNLTDAQKAQVKDIMEATRAKVQPLKESMKANRQKMNDATANGQFDEATVSAIAQEQATIGAQLIVEKERAKSQMFQILTAEQKTQMQQFEAQMKERFENRQNRREKKAEQNEDDGVQ
jgi:periplasmic protein CpxP/Spy